jgi:hypothetical protein
MIMYFKNVHILYGDQTHTYLLFNGKKGLKYKQKKRRFYNEIDDNVMGSHSIPSTVFHVPIIVF